MHRVLLRTFTAENDKEDCNKNCTHAQDIFATHFLAEHGHCEETGYYGLQTANDTDRRHVKVINTAEGDID